MKRVVLSSIITLGILVLLAVAYFYFQRYSIITADPMNAIPSNAIFFIETKNAKATSQKLVSENLLGSLTNADSTTTNNLLLLDSAFSTNDAIKDIWEDKTIFISAHLTKANSFDYLYLANVPSSWTDAKTVHFISEAFHIESSDSKRVYENVVVHELAISPDKNFSFAVTKGIFIGSFTSFLIDDAIRQLKNGSSFSKSKAFTKVSKSPDAKDEASVYINYISLREFLSAFSSYSNNSLFSGIGSFARWSKLATEILDNGIILRGLTASTDSSDYITTLKMQQPQKILMTEILPSRTALLLHIGVSDYSKYFHHLLNNSTYYDSPDKRSQMVGLLENKFTVDVEKLFTEWIGNELALVVTEPGSASFENSSYACLKANDIEMALTDLSKLETAINIKGTSDLGEYRKHPLRFINLAGLAPLFYSGLFSNVNKFYYTAIGSYIIVANQAGALRSFVDDYEDNKILSTDVVYKNVSRNLERTSNFLLYANLERAKNIFRHYGSEDLNSMIDKNQTLMNRFTSFTFQLTNQHEDYKTSVQFLSGKEKIKNVNLLWAAQLDTAIDMAPFLVTNPETKNKSIVVQDMAHNLYLIDDAGNIVWKKVLPEKIMSTFHVVDAYKNGQEQILFNTSSQLYLLDLSGNDYGNYPIHLPATATNGCEVFDFDQAKNYKIFVACNNRLVYAYDISGKPMTGWFFYQPVSNVTKPLQYFKTGDKDYIVVYNNTGNVFVLDRKGTIRTSLKQTFIGKHSSFSLMPGDSLEEDHLVTTDTSGTVLNIFFNGVIKSKSYAKQKSEHAFAVADLDGDGKNDFAFLDFNRIKAIKQDGTEIYSHVFSSALSNDLYAFSFANSFQQLAAGSNAENKFYVLNKDGKPSNGFPVKGFKAIVTNDWGSEGKRILVTSGTDGNVYLYIVD